MKIITFNNKGFKPMAQWRVRRGYKVVEDRNPDLVSIQEAFISRYILSISRVFSKLEYDRFAPVDTSGTVVLHRRSKFTTRRSGSVRLHRGIHGISSHRNITFEVVRDRSNGKTIAHASTHFTPGAWTERFSSRTREKVKAQWREGASNLKGFIKRNVEAGHLVVVGLDSNSSVDILKHFLGPVIAGQPVQIVSDGIIHIIFVGQWRVIDTNILKRTLSDHDPLVVIADAF